VSPSCILKKFELCAAVIVKVEEFSSLVSKPVPIMLRLPAQRLLVAEEIL